jgi:2-octaprenyl-6-methoxyphenol hydroxylase
MTRRDHAAAADTFDAEVLIVGGGLVGGTLACALGQVGIATVIVESAPLPALLDDRYDGRASAIALTSRRLFEAIGVWEGIADVAEPMLDIRVSDGNSPLFLHYDHRLVGDQPFGHMVENQALRRALVTRMGALAAVRLLAPAKVGRLDRDGASVRAELADGRRISARLAVAADGRSSRTREDAGIRTTTWNYRQIGIVCTVAHQQPHRNVAHEHFLPAGPFAILPLRGNRASIVWTERADLAPAILALDDAGFAAELRLRFGDFLGEVQVIGPRWSYPLSLQFAETAVGQRLALVGDAYHGMHPIAGQGFNMGLRDVAALAEVVTDAARQGGDVGTAPVLARYERWRRFDNHLMLAMTDALNRLFSNDNAVVRLARDVGLAAVGRIRPLKRLLMRHAMGDVGDLPRLLRGLPL